MKPGIDAGGNYHPEPRGPNGGPGIITIFSLAPTASAISVVSVYESHLDFKSLHDQSKKLAWFSVVQRSGVFQKNAAGY